MQENGSEPTREPCRYPALSEKKTKFKGTGGNKMFKNKYNKIYFYTYITIFFLRHIIIANLSQNTAAELFQTNCQKNKYF